MIVDLHPNLYLNVFIKNINFCIFVIERRIKIIMLFEIDKFLYLLIKNWLLFQENKKSWH